MLIGLINILIFLITGGLIVTLVARVQAPFNLVLALTVVFLLLTLTVKFFGWANAFTILYLLWMLGIIGGLYGYREYLRRAK